MENNEYEIKVRTEIGFHCSEWSEVIKIKTGKKDKNEINIGFSKIFGNNISNNKETKTIFSPSTTNPFQRLFDNNNNIIQIFYFCLLKIFNIWLYHI